MKKIFIIVIIILLLFTSSKQTDDVIRIRIIANSNSTYDQSVKLNLSNLIRKELYDLLKNENNIVNARKIIKNNLNTLDSIINENVTDYSYSINYGMNYFPEKKYNGKTYKEGNYESLVIALGEGKGDNWWCILFPPLCLVEAEESENVEYKFLLKDIFSKIFK